MNVGLYVANTFKRYFPDIPIKRELQNDGSFETPSFFVQQLDTRARGKPGNEQVRTYAFDIVYLTDQEDMQVLKATEMEDAVLSQFDYLLDENGKPMTKIQDLHTRMVDQDLHILFSAQFRMQQTDTGELFQQPNLTQREEIKHG